MPRSNVLIRKPTLGAPSVVALPSGVLVPVGFGTIQIVSSPRRVPTGVAAAAAAGTATGPSPPFDPATTRYVRQGASGSGSGLDWTNAFPSLPSTLQRGFTYYIADGTYSGYTFDDNHSGTMVITIKKATVAEHGTNTGWLDTYGDGVAAFTSKWAFTRGYYTIDGAVGGWDGVNWSSWTTGYGITLTGSGDVIDLNTANAIGLTFRRIDATNTTGSSTGIDGSNIVKAVKDIGTGVFFSNGQGIRDTLFEYCYFHDIGGVFFHTFAMSNVLVQFCAIHRNGQLTEPAENEVHRELWSGSADDNVTFRWNYIRGISSTAVWAFVNGGGVCNGIEIYRNIIHNEAPNGSYFAHASLLIDASGGSSGCTPTNWKFVHNTITGWESGTPKIDFNASGSNNIVKNNLWANIPVSGTMTIGGTHTHNAFHEIIHEEGGANQAAGLAAGESNGQHITAEPFADYPNRWDLAADTNLGDTLGSPYDMDIYGRTGRSRGALQVAA